MPGDSSGVGEVYAERCAEAGILLLGNTVPLFNEDRTLAAPSNWLDGNELGYNMATWFVENHSHFGFDISNMSSVGYLYIHDTTVATMPPRVNGSMGVMREAFPELQDDHIFSADVSVDRNVSIMECSYNLVAATLTANPRIEKWIIFGFLDDYGTGACRAIEDLGFVDNAFLISAGGENAIPEWDAGLTRPWYAANLITGMDCALQQVEAIDRILRQGVAPEDVHPNKGPGERFGLASYSGQMIDYETYRSVIG
jgi:ABC-type sugar transport system substrate-binding protein